MEILLKITMLQASLLLSLITITNGLSNPLSGLYAKLSEYSLRNPATYLQAIVPGTKWCGDGSNAKNYNDLGYFVKTDTCCRDHDSCDDLIVAGESKHELTNTGKFTRLHCKCDLTFYECLVNADKMVSRIVGTGYFNGLGAKCYDETYPATCIKYESVLGERCIEYSYDETQPKKWQWLDVKRYIN